jgi:hypothetical protein
MRERSTASGDSPRRLATMADSAATERECMWV